MKISITIETMMGFTWPIWKDFIPKLERMGFHSIFRSDHFPMGEPPTTNALDLVTSLAYLADHTQRVNFGTLVAPLSVRDPVILAREAMSLNDLSGGRFILGVGTGHNEPEHRQFGYDLGDVKTRLDRLEEGLQVISALLRKEEPVSFEGRFYHLKDARLLPRPQQPTRILVGGNGLKRTLPMAARYANMWNCQVASVQTFRELNQRLDELILAEGRHPADVKRSAMVPVMIFRNLGELEKILESYNTVSGFPPMDAQSLMEIINSMNGITGPPEEVIEKIQANADAGVEEFVIQWFNPHGMPWIEELAGLVLPHFAVPAARETGMGVTVSETAPEPME